MKEIKKKVEVEKILYVSDDGKRSSEEWEDIHYYENQLFAKTFPDEFFKTINNHAVFINGNRLMKENFINNCDCPLEVILFNPFTKEELEAIDRYSKIVGTPLCLKKFCTCIRDFFASKDLSTIHLLSFEKISLGGYTWVYKGSLQKLKSLKRELEQEIQNIEQIVEEYSYGKD